MRKSFPIILLLMCVAALGFCSCRRTSDNGKIDGLWKIISIEYLPGADASGTISPDNLFYAVNLELFQLCSPMPNETGVLTYHKGDRRFSVDFRNGPSHSKLLQYGLGDNPVMLDIEVLDSKRMVLRSDVAIVTCRRF